MKKRNKIAKDLFTSKYRKRVVKPKKGKGSFKRKKTQFKLPLKKFTVNFTASLLSNFRYSAAETSRKIK